MIARKLLVVLTVLALVAVACGDDGDDSESGSPEVDTDAPATEDPPADADSGGADDEEQDGDAGEADDGSDEPVELFASAPGVTAESIKVGVAYIDLSALAGVIDLDHGSYENAFRAVIDDVNASGGVLGRSIEPVFAPIDVLDPQSADAACLRLTEDEEVFVVFASVQTAQVPCYVDIGETPVVGAVPNDEVAAKARAPWFTYRRNVDEGTREIVEGFAERGIFDGATVGVVASIDDQQTMEQTALPLLDELGIEPAETAIITTPIIFTEEVRSEVGLIATRFEAVGVDTVLAVGGGVALWTLGIRDLGYAPRLATTDLGSLRAYIRDEANNDLSILEDSVAGNQPEQLAWWDDPLTQECIGIVEAAGEPEIIDPNVRAEGEPENIVSVNAACATVDLFVAIAEAAGADLTPETFGAAGESLGEHTVPSYGPGVWTPDAPDGDLPIYFFEWDDEAQDLVSDGETFG